MNVQKALTRGQGLRLSSIPLNSTNEKVSLMRQKIVALNNTIEANEKTIEDLKIQQKEAGIPPSGSIPNRLGMRVSTEKEKLGELETKFFSLEKKACRQNYFIESMKKQLANSKVNP